MCFDNASVAVSMRKKAEVQGLVLFSYRCFDYAVNLICKDFCQLPIFVSALRGVVKVAPHFHRYTRARAAFQKDCPTHAAAGHRVGQIVTFSAAGGSVTAAPCALFWSTCLSFVESS